MQRFIYLSLTHVDVQTNEHEFDRELFEPVHEGWDGEEDAIDNGHGLLNKDLYDDDDGIRNRHTQGTATITIVK